MRRFAAVLLLLAASHPLAAARAACPLPAQNVAAPPLFAALNSSIAQRQVRILAVGSGATTGAEGTTAHGFPAHMLAALRAALPGVEVALTVRGGRGMSAEQLLPRLRDGLRQTSPAVVLWQTGTVEAVHGLRTDRMRDALRAGLAASREAGASLVLIDPQYTRALHANADVVPYETTLRSIGAEPGASLFSRYDLTREWVTRGQIDPETAPTAARASVLNRLDGCVGEALARYLLNGAGITLR
jgi:acyl-CoA thioesterase-1